MKKRAVIIGLFIFALAAAAFIYTIAGRKPASASAQETTDTQTSEGVVYIFYANTYLSLDKDAMVCANSSSRPAAIPEIGGITFDSLSFGKKADAVERTGLEYLIRVACSLQKHGISAERIEYNNRMATIYIGKLKIELGKDDKTEEKLTDLADLIENIRGSSGTLYMQNGNANNYGYTFRSDH